MQRSGGGQAFVYAKQDTPEQRGSVAALGLP